MSEAPAPWMWLLPVGLFLVVFPAIWLFVTWLLAMAGGWRRLAQRYAHPRPLPVSMRGGQFGFLGVVRYKYVLHVGSNAQCLFLDVALPFRPVHAALRIPWRDIRHRRERTWYGWDLDVFEIGQPTLAVLKLRAGTVRMPD